jgi:hypothetical protein
MNHNLSTIATNNLLARALSSHRQGQLGEAEDLYIQALNLELENCEVLS